MRVSEVKENMDKPVVCLHNGLTYSGTLVAYTLRTKEGRLLHQAEILDKNNNSVAILPLADVNAVNMEE